jgi:hypothetical protein
MKISGRKAVDCVVKGDKITVKEGRDESCIPNPRC